MGSMPIYHVNKAPFGFLDTQFGGEKSDFLPAYDAVLATTPSGSASLEDTVQSSGKTLQDRALEHTQAGGNLTTGQVSHFVNHWLGTWWPNLSVADTLRWGILKAIKRAKKKELPMEFFWVCLQDNVFQVYYSQGPQQVTVLILTPPPPHGYDGPQLQTAEDLWVVKRWDHFDDDYPTINNTPAGLVDPPATLGFTTTGPAGTIIQQRIWRG